MSHHFDTPTQKNPRINVCDFYLFRGRPGITVMALTVNQNAGVGGPDTFRDEGLYAFRRNHGRLPPNGFIERARRSLPAFCTPPQRASDKALAFFSQLGLLPDCPSA